MSVNSLSAPGSSHGDSTSFIVDIDVIGGRLRLRGQLDRTNIHLLDDAISTLLLNGRESWVIDATDLTGCDHSGVRAIAAAHRRALRHNRRVTLIGSPPALPRD